MDPNCPYCHQFDKDARDAAAAGKAFRLLVLPVAILGPDSRDKAIRILAAPDPAAAWLQFMADKALPPVPADATLANQVLDANMKVMMRWNLTMVPHLQWQEEGRTMVIRGNPNDLENFWLRLVAKP
jgi:thiol:disulfide interchange protein DsbG